jgi:sugar lactone lactonase YvrE
LSAKERRVRCVAPAAAMLGEGPLWIAAESALYWVDILGDAIHRYDAVRERSGVFRMPFAITALAPMADGRLLCTSHRRLHAFDPRSGRIATSDVFDAGSDSIRINDGSCHPDGAFWFGTMDLEERAPTGDFFRLAIDGRCSRVPSGFAITNGPAFSPDGALGYFVDTLHRRILRAPIENGIPADAPTSFVEIAADEGYPDGLAIDADGGLWCAHFGGGRISRFDASGERSESIALPVSNVTKAAFGGEAFDRLYVTTARKDLDADALAAEPLAGGLFEIEVGHRGLPPHEYRGAMRFDAATQDCVFETS